MALNHNADMLTRVPKDDNVSAAENHYADCFFHISLCCHFIRGKKGFTKFSIGIGPFMLFKKTLTKKSRPRLIKNALSKMYGARALKTGLSLVAATARFVKLRMYRNLKTYGCFQRTSSRVFSSRYMLFTINSSIRLVFYSFCLLIIELFFE